MTRFVEKIKPFFEKFLGQKSPMVSK